MERKKAVRSFKNALKLSFLVFFVFMLAVSVIFAHKALAQTTTTAQLTAESAKVTSWGYLAAAIAAGLGCIGAGIAVAYVGAASVGAIGEKPELVGRTLIFVGLAEGIAIYGLIIAIMILGKL